MADARSAVMLFSGLLVAVTILASCLLLAMIGVLGPPDSVVFLAVAAAIGPGAIGATLVIASSAMKKGSTRAAIYILVAASLVVVGSASLIYVAVTQYPSLRGPGGFLVLVLAAVVAFGLLCIDTVGRAMRYIRLIGAGPEHGRGFQPIMPKEIGDPMLKE